MKKILLLTVITLFALIPHNFAQGADIAQLTAEKYVIEFQDKSYVIHYGYAGSFEIEIEKEVKNPKIISMSINPEKKSLEIDFEKTPEISVMWFRLPKDLISAEGGNFEVLVNDVKTGYDMVNYQDDVRIGFILEKDTLKVEIIGTHIVPEFATTIGILVTSMIVVTLLLRFKFFKINLGAIHQ